MLDQHDMPSSDGLKLHYARGGEGPEVVLIHGALSCLEDPLIALEDALAPRYSITAFDRPGHGRSGRRRLQTSTWRQAEVLSNAVRALDIRRPVLIGHSFGGAVAMAWALADPEDIAGVVALAPVALPELRAEHILFGPRAVPVFGDLWTRAMGPMIDSALGPVLLKAMFAPQEPTERFKAGFPAALALDPRHLQADGEDAMAALADLGLMSLRYGACKVPVRVLAGDRDRIVNPLHGRLLARVVPDGAFQSLGGLGHMLHHFAPEAVAAAVEAILAAG